MTTPRPVTGSQTPWQIVRNNRWLRRHFGVVVPAAALNCVFIEVDHPHTAYPFVSCLVEAAASVLCWLMAVRTEEARPLVVPAAAAPKWTPRLTNPEPGQCPVCGCDDLAFWREMDEWSLRVGEERHVQPYGGHEAHRFCKELVPYQAPPAARILITPVHPTSILAVDRRVEPGEYTINGVVQTVVSCTSRRLDGAYTVTLSQRLGVEAACGTELLPHKDAWPITFHCQYCNGFEKVHGRSEMNRVSLEHMDCRTSKRPQSRLANAGLMMPKGFEPDVVINPGRVFTGPDGEEYVTYAPPAGPGHNHAPGGYKAACGACRRSDDAWYRDRARQRRDRLGMSALTEEEFDAFLRAARGG